MNGEHKSGKNAHLGTASPPSPFLLLCSRYINEFSTSLFVEDRTFVEGKASIRRGKEKEGGIFVIHYDRCFMV